MNPPIIRKLSDDRTLVIEHAFDSKKSTIVHEYHGEQWHGSCELTKHVSLSEYVRDMYDIAI
jgi:hypothetical protein